MKWIPNKRFVSYLGLLIFAFLQAGCGSKCGYGPCGTAPLTASTMQLTFANQSVGSSNSPQAVMLTASGTESSLISGITISGDFSQTNTCGKYLAPNTSCSVSVVFTPTAMSARTSQLVVGEGMSVQMNIGLMGTGQ